MTIKGKPYYYRIIPLTRTSLNRDPYFTYASTEKLSFGDLVEIDFSGKKMPGIVHSRVGSKPPYKTKQIKKTIEKKVLDEKQFKLAKFISEYYLTSPGIVLKGFIGKQTKRKKAPAAPTILDKKNLSKKIQLTLFQKSGVEKIIKSKKQYKEFLITGPASSGKTEVAMKCIEKTLKSKKQALVLVPEILLSYQEIRRYIARFSDYQVAIYHSELTVSEKSFVIDRVKSGKLDLVIATKIGCFLPFQELGMVIVDEEQDVSHKNWDQSPRYHVRKTAKWLSAIHSAKLAFLSATPSAEISNDCQKKKTIEIVLPMLELPKIKISQPSFEFIDLRSQYYKNNRKNTAISDDLKEKLEKIISQKNQIAFILVPRRGKGKALVCADCREKLVCPQCHLPLIQSGGKYRCLHCSFKQSDLSQCPRCRSFRIFNVGYGTESVVDKIKTMLPSAKIAMADQEVLSKRTAKENLYKEIASGKINILVGTQTIIKGFDLPNVSLAACLNAEAFAGKTDFKFDERWLGSLFQAAGRVNRPGSRQNGVFLIQAFNPQNELFNHLQSWNWRNFIKSELQSRKSINYPPFAKFIKIIYRQPLLKKVEKKIEKVYNELQALEDKNILSVSAPYFGNIKKINKNFQKHILIKVKQSESHPLKLKKFLQKLGEGWYFDVDPENIF